MNAPSDGSAATATVAEPVQPGKPLTFAEMTEFAGVLGVPPESLRTPPDEPLPSNATDAVATYEQLVADPIKSLLARSTDYYQTRKAELVREWASEYFSDTSCRGLRVLEIGCGAGDLMRALEPHFDDVRGCDPSASMVRRAGAKAVCMPSPTRLPFESHSFDIAICACVYHHIEPRLRVAHMAEARRVLGDGGGFMMFEHNPRNPLTKLIVRRCPIDSGARLLAAREAKALMSQAGYRDIRTRYYLFLPEALYRRAGWLERRLSWTTLGGQFCAAGRNICL